MSFRNIPDDSRYIMAACADDVPLAAYLDHRWAARDATYAAKHGEPVVRGAWPYRTAAETVEVKRKTITLPERRRA